MSRDVLMLLFKLRNNIVLEGDVGLAERELQSLLGQAVQPVYTDDMKQWESAQWVLPKDIELRRGGVAGYLCTAEAADLTRLFWRLSFCEQVFGVAPNTEYIRELLSRLPASFVRCRVIRGRLTFMFVPFSAVAEWSDVVARRARSPSEVEASLDYLCKAIVSEQPTTLPQTLRGVLAAKQTTGHLFHGLHVYKAKFFPLQTVRGDARSLPLEAQSIDCVVTSPPYMPASSGRENYLKSKAYAMTALGLVAPDSVDALEAELIGSVQRTEPINDLPADAVKLVEWMQSDPTRCVKAAATARYFADIRESLREIRRVLKPNGKCAYVVAQRHVFYRYKSREVVRVVENADIIAELARQAGLEVQELIHVELQKQNTIARPRSLDAYYETIVLLEKR